MRTYGLHWFRRDLRVQGNRALLEDHARHGGRVLGVFFFDSQFLARPDFSSTRFAFFLDTLVALRDELRSLGGDLLVIDAPPERGWVELIQHLARSPQGKPASVSFNRDYEPFARARDEKVQSLLEETSQIRVHTERDHLLIEPAELSKSDRDGGFYQIYTPFAKKWFSILRRPEILARLDASLQVAPRFSLRWDDIAGNSPRPDALESFRQQNAKYVTVPIPEAGARAAWKALEIFAEKIDPYQTQRDFPAEPATSRLSMFFKNGSITTAQVIAQLGLKNTPFAVENGRTRFLKELVWREFYYHILWHCPRVEIEAFQKKFLHLPWENREDLFEAWKNGQTGYPIVDAGMRELQATGWMHNRVRMIVASFLTKDLLIDWRWGEQYFMERLLDGDLAPNNGGWQWAASTGCDPQPYFRVFNPTLQSEKFDPAGAYLKKWLPERAHLTGKALHAPIHPVVEHASRKLKALSMYTRASDRAQQDH